MIKLISCFLIILTVTTLFGCVSQQHYRQGNFVTQGPTCTQSTKAEDCETAEEGKGGEGENYLPYFLGIVEFDDSGLLFKLDQLDFVIDQLKNRTISDPNHVGTIVVAFAHGWTHNAAPDDESLVFFRDLLKLLAKHEQRLAKKEGRKPRLVQGVYLAWHGHSMIKGFEQVFTFYARKTTAYRIGEREATQTLLRLREAVYENSATVSLPKDDFSQAPNRFIIVGHSFGGALVYSAISQLLSFQQLCQFKTSPEQQLADSVILINPAVEAIRVLPLIQTLSHNESCQKILGIPRPRLAIFTSDSDDATKRAFSWAGLVSTIPSSIFGISYRDEVPNPIRSDATATTSEYDTDKLSERDANSRSIGHFDPLVTHFLVRSNDLMAEKAGCSKARSNLNDYSQKNYTHLDFGRTCLVVADPIFASDVPGFDKKITPLRYRQLAVFNVKVSDQIWDGHGLEQTEERKDIFLSFLGQFIPFSLGVKNL